MKLYAQKCIHLPPFIEDFDTLILSDAYICAIDAFSAFIKGSEHPIKRLIVDGYKVKNLEQILALLGEL